MMLLGIDTTLGACSAALIERDLHAGSGPGRVVASVCERMVQGHAERLLPMVQRVLHEAGLSMSDCAGIAVTVGPGTFTGIRVGVSAARGFAVARDVPVFTATSLALMAATAGSGRGAAGVIAAADARNGQLYVQSFGAGGLVALDEPRILDVAVAAAGYRDAGRGCVVAGNGAALLASAMADDDRAPAAVIEVNTEPDARNFAVVDLVQVNAPVPLYLRQPDAKPQPSAALPRAVP